MWMNENKMKENTQNYPDWTILRVVWISLKYWYFREGERRQMARSWTVTFWDDGVGLRILFSKLSQNRLKMNLLVEN